MIWVQCFYWMLNKKKQMLLIIDKQHFSLVDLTKPDMETNENKKCHIDSWTSFFKNTTWKEIKLFTLKNRVVYA